MVLKEFRIAHSTLIEHYQFVESHIEGIYAAVSGKPFFSTLEEIEKASLSGALREVEELERQKGIRLFTPEEYKQLRQMIESRNFWVHCCYYEMTFDLKTGGPAKVQDVQRLVKDLKTAEQWREKLFQKKVELLKNSSQIL